MASMEILKAGTRREIRNGLSTKVWNVPWLPSTENRFMTTNMPNQMCDVLVNGFMCSEEKRWDMDVITNMCNNRDVELIKRIPIPLVDTPDSWFWQFDESGSFSVKSCYRWIQGERDSTHRRFWNTMWSLKLPCKVINCLWRVSKCCLPMLSALISLNARCPWCHNEVETD